MNNLNYIQRYDLLQLFIVPTAIPWKISSIDLISLFNCIFITNKIQPNSTTVFSNVQLRLMIFITVILPDIEVNATLSERPSGCVTLNFIVSCVSPWTIIIIIVPELKYTLEKTCVDDCL